MTQQDTFFPGSLARRLLLLLGALVAVGSSRLAAQVAVQSSLPGGAPPSSTMGAPGSAVLAPADVPSGRVMLPSRTVATLADAKDLGPLNAGQPLTLTLTLAQPPARRADLAQFLEDLHTVSSPNYHQWVTPAQFAARFGATGEQLAAASAWAQAQGMTVSAVSPAGERITVAATAAQAQAAFAVTLHSLARASDASATYFAADVAPSLPQAAAGLFAAVDGLDNLPAASLKASYLGSKGGVTAEPQTLASLAATVDANLTSTLALESSICAGSLSEGQLLAYTAVLEQAAAQGISTLATRGCTTGAFPAGLAEVTGVSLAGDAPETGDTLAERPTWQVAQGLPADAFRHAPDVTVPSLAAFAQTLATIGGGGRLGNVAKTLYALAPVPGLYTQSASSTPVASDIQPALSTSQDAAPASHWEPATGLGTVNLAKLATVYPRGVGASSTSLTISNYVPVHGQGTSFTSNVTSGTGGALPTGTVSFVANGLTLANIALNNGTATYSTDALTGGNYAISANYSGDATYAASSNPSPATIYVAPEASNLGVQIAGSAVIGGSFNVIVTDAAPSGVGQPSGAVTVTLPVNGAVYTGTLAPAGASSATATVSVPAPAVGTLTLSINCTSSLSYSCSNPYVTTVTVAKATPTLAISFSPNPPVSGNSLTLNATVTGVGSAPVPTGNVQFFDNGTTLNAGALSSGSTTTVATVPTTATHTITATYMGDPNYNAVSTTAGSTTSGAISTRLALSASASTVVAGQNVTFTAILTPASNGSAQPTGSVQFFDNGNTLLGTQSVSGNVASLTSATLSPSTNHSMTAIYTGDSLYTGSTSPAVTVGKSVTLVSTTLGLSSSSATYAPGVTLNLIATITPATVSSTGPTGSVQFFNNGVSLGSAAVTSGSALFSTSFSAGTQLITAVYSGDTSYAGSNSAGLTLAKSTATTPSMTTISVTPSTVVLGGTLTLSAIVTPTVNNTPPTGNVQFLAGGSTACTATLAGSTASCTVPATSIGSLTFTANYPGDANYSASASALVSAMVTAPPATLTASISPASAAGGAVVTVNATLVAANGTVPAGQISATILGVTGALANATLPATANTSTVTVAIPITAPATAGAYMVVVSCAGLNFTCTPVTVQFTSTGASSANKIATSTALALSATTLPASGAETLTATVSPASAGASQPTGSVMFFDGITLIGTAPVSAAGAGSAALLTASVAVVLTPGVNHSLTAVYAGDTLYATSTSAAATLGSTLSSTAAVTLSSSVSSALVGSAINLTAQVSGLSATGLGPTGSVSFYVAGSAPTLLGTVQLTPANAGLAVATLSTGALNAGSVTVYAVYSGDKSFATVTSNQLTLALGSYGVTFSPQSLSLHQGQSGTSTLTLGLLGGFSGTVSFGCTPPPNYAMTCSLSPASLVNGGGTVLTVTTSAARGQAVEGPAHAAGLGAAGAVCAALLFLLLAPGGWRGHARRRLPGLLLLTLVVALSANMGCSTASNPVNVQAGAGTPLGTTILTITTSGTDGVHVVRQNYSFQVTVQ